MIVSALVSQTSTKLPQLRRGRNRRKLSRRGGGKRNAAVAAAMERDPNTSLARLGVAVQVEISSQDAVQPPGPPVADAVPDER